MERVGWWEYGLYSMGREHEERVGEMTGREKSGGEYDGMKGKREMRERKKEE